MIQCNQSTLSPEDVTIYISSDYIVRQTIIHFIMRAYRQQNLRLRVESSRLNQIYPMIPFLVLFMLYNPLLWTGTVLFVATPPYPP